MKLFYNESGNLQMLQAGVILVVLITILYVGLAVNSSVISATDLDPISTATGTITFTGNGSANETFEVSTETYIMKAAVPGVWTEG